MKKILLITGFEKFGDYEENISEVVARKIQLLGNYEVKGIVFPVRIFPDSGKDYGETIVAYAKEIGATAIISLGIASKASGIEIEGRACNWVENSKYCLPSEQRHVIDKTMILKKELKVNLNRWRLSRSRHISSLFEKLQEKKLYCDVTLSSNAGTFCCNALMFRTLRALEKNNCEIPYLFLHLNPSLNLYSLIIILETIIENLESEVIGSQERSNELRI